MKNILEQFLDEIEVGYTRWYADKLYNEHPHKYNMYGLKQMLNIYGVKTLGVQLASKDVTLLNYPCILHTSDDFVIGLECNADTITYLYHEKRIKVSHGAFMQKWTGNALLISETANAIEPDYKLHHREECLLRIKAYSIPMLLLFAVIVGICCHITILNIFHLVDILLNIIGLSVCVLLMQKQLFGKSHYGDRVCSLFHQSDCNNILDGPYAKILGISWSEIGLGYFIANTLLLSLYPNSISVVVLINWLAMGYGIWSIYYQCFVAKNWCMLCVVVQGIIWIMGLEGLLFYQWLSFENQIIIWLIVCFVLGFTIIIIHSYSIFIKTKNEYITLIQQYRSFKANNAVAEIFIKAGEYHETRMDDSSIILGNPNAKIRISILSNPHCNPCAKMHFRVEKILATYDKNICIQYIFSAFNKDLEESNRYLIAHYKRKEEYENRKMITKWYEQDRFHQEDVISKSVVDLHSNHVDLEMERHAKWRARTGIMATPTILINGYILPSEYSIEDLPLIVDFSLNK